MEHSPNFFAAPQCLGYRNEHGVATADLCLPSENTIVKKLKRVIKSIGAKSVFVASDNDFMIELLTKALQKMKVTNCSDRILTCRIKSIRSPARWDWLLQI